jgi:hypothetical protein
MRNYLKEYSQSCPICGMKLEDLQIDKDSVEFSYQCGHEAKLEL